MAMVEVLISRLLYASQMVDELTWPLKEKFEVKLLNQMSDCEHHSKSILYAEEDYGAAARVMAEGGTISTGHGHPQFISIADLEEVTATHQYLKDDCIFIQISKL